MARTMMGNFRSILNRKQTRLGVAICESIIQKVLHSGMSGSINHWKAQKHQGEELQAAGEGVTGKAL